MGRRRQRRGDTKSQKKQKKRRQYLGFAPPVKAVNVKWDRRATLKQNYKRLGLLSSTGDIEAPMPKGELTKELNRIQNEPVQKAHKIIQMSVQHQRMISRLIKKHADDYKAMERDLDLNVMQFTETQLKKKCEIYQMLILL